MPDKRDPPARRYLVEHRAEIPPELVDGRRFPGGVLGPAVRALVVADQPDPHVGQAQPLVVPAALGQGIAMDEDHRQGGVRAAHFLYVQADAVVGPDGPHPVGRQVAEPLARRGIRAAPDATNRVPLGGEADRRTSRYQPGDPGNQPGPAGRRPHRTPPR